MHKMFVEGHDCSCTFIIIRKHLIYSWFIFPLLGIAWETSKILKHLIHEIAYKVLILSDSIDQLIH